MTLYRNTFLTALMLLIIFASAGTAFAEGEAEMTSQQFCELEAKQAGMENPKDVQEYVAQCLAEIELQKNADEAPESAR
ncbi:MAG: hypothetical protein RRB22_14015 [Gammaproteobacteria bacterium]|nr:hypothetical protein [Gammaproteobacteria bacterium]